MLVCRLQLATSKGLVAGDLQFTDADGNVVDCAAHNLVLDSPADHYLRAVGRQVLWSAACVCLSVCVCALFLSARYLKNGFMNHHQIRWVGAGGEPLKEV